MRVALCHFYMQGIIYITGVNLVSSILVYECACLDPLVTWPGFTVSSSVRRRDAPPTRLTSSFTSRFPFPVCTDLSPLRSETMATHSLGLSWSREMRICNRVWESAGRSWLVLHIYIHVCCGARRSVVDEVLCYKHEVAGSSNIEITKQ
jgi:hypothetical protein